MDPADRKKIDDNRVFILKNLHVDVIFLAELRQSGTLNDCRVDDIMDSNKKVDRADNFLKILVTRGPKAFGNFISALVNTEQVFLAKALDPHLVKQLEAQKSNAEPSSPDLKNTEDIKPPTFQTAQKSAPLPREEDEADLTSYEISASPRGRAIILNNREFESRLGTRFGSEIDVESLTDLLEDKNFQVVPWINCTAQEIKDKIDLERQNEFHQNADIFIFVAMSHGDKELYTSHKMLGSIFSREVFFGTDGTALDIDRDILDKFDGEKCRALIHKPKLFFLQCCRGEKITKGVQRDLENTACLDAGALEHPERDALGGTAHEKADILKFCSTVSGYASCRFPTKGSVFIQTLVKTFREHAQDRDVHWIATKVNNDVEEMKIPVGGCNFTQISCFYSSLRKPLFLP